MELNFLKETTEIKLDNLDKFLHTRSYFLNSCFQQNEKK